jgi:hypothetical protein
MRPAINDGDEIALYDPEGDEDHGHHESHRKVRADRSRQDMGMRKGLHGRRHPDRRRILENRQRRSPRRPDGHGPETGQPGRTGQGAQRRRLSHQVCRRLPSPAESRKAFRGSRLERSRRPAVAQPHASLPRIPVQDRRGSVRRRLHSLSGRQPETGRHSGRSSRRNASTPW